MRGRNIIAAIMEKTGTTNAKLADRLGISSATAWDRVNTKKTKDIPVSMMAEMVRTMDYKVVVVPRTTKINQEWFEVS